MLDIGWSEMAVIAMVALVVIGPKDLPRVLRTIGQWTRKARTLAREFQSGLDEMIHEAELDEARKTVERTRKLDIGKEFERTVDPEGEVAREARALDAAGRSSDSGQASAKAKAGAKATKAAGGNGAENAPEANGSGASESGSIASEAGDDARSATGGAAGSPSPERVKSS